MVDRTRIRLLGWGFVIGVIVAIIVPLVLGPYLPGRLFGGPESIAGVVRDKRVERDRVLLTLVAPGGTILATFTEQVSEIDLLVQVGDSVALNLDAYVPFVNNPVIGRVSKGEPSTQMAVPQTDTLPREAADSIDRAVTPADSLVGDTATTTQPDSTPSVPADSTITDSTRASRDTTGTPPDTNLVR